METNLLGSGVSIKGIDISLGLGEIAKAITEYMESRNKSAELKQELTEKEKQERRNDTINDLHVAFVIVQVLTNRYIDLMQTFASEEIIKDHNKLNEVISGAQDYLVKREILPQLDILAGQIFEQAKLFSSVGWTLRSAHEDLIRFRQSLVGGKGLETGIGIDALKSRIQGGKKFLKSFSDDELKEFVEKTQTLLTLTDVSASDRAYTSIGRAIGKLKGAP